MTSRVSSSSQDFELAKSATQNRVPVAPLLVLSDARKAPAMVWESVLMVNVALLALLVILWPEAAASLYSYRVASS